MSEQDAGSHNLRVIQAMAKHIAGKSPSRPQLHGVLIQERINHAIYVATNGVIAIVYKQEGDFAEQGKEFLLPSGLALTPKILARQSGNCDIELNEDKVSLTFNSATFSGAVGTGFPESWPRIFPEPGYEPSMAWFLPEELVALNKFAKLAGLNPSHPIQNGENPALINYKSGHCVGIIMPLRRRYMTVDSDVERFW